MTLEEFENAYKRDQGHVVEVFKHKTDYKGPAALSIDLKLYNEMLIYLKIRNSLPCIHTDPCDKFFVSWSGGKMSSNMIGTQFTEFFSKCTGLRITATIVRKYVTTTVHKHMPEFKSQTANHLCHSEPTAAKSMYCIGFLSY